MLEIDDIMYFAGKAGLSLCGYSNLDQYRKEKKNLKIWQEKGFAADLNYMKRDTSLFFDLNNFLPGTKSIISFACYYNPVSKIKCPKGYGRVARYALGRDYHKVLKKRVQKFVASIKQAFGIELNFKIFTDAVPLLERSLASHSNLGFIGKNTMLIHPKNGSFSLLAEVLFDIEIKIKNPILRKDAGCKTCTKCLNACPTNAFEAPYMLDSRKCISYFTIEKKGLINKEDARLIYDWVFGCDICQEVCPFNYKHLKKYNSLEDGDFLGRISNNGLINLEELFKINTNEIFLKKYAGTPFMRAKREGILRNAMCVVLNTECSNLMHYIEGIAMQDQSSMLMKQAQALLSNT